MILRVNGEDLEVAEGLDIVGLLERLRLPRDGVAVAVDGVVVPRREHVGRALRAGERVEVIRAVGGG